VNARFAYDETVTAEVGIDAGFRNESSHQK